MKEETYYPDSPSLLLIDAQKWSRIEKTLPHTRITSDVYDAIDLAGQAAAVVGPWFLPHDALALQIAASIGPQGSFFSADPRGDNFRGDPSETYGAGNSEILARQITALKSVGLLLPVLNWLGPDSSLVHIPVPDSSLDLVSDHAIIEFLSKKLSPGYLRNGAVEIVRSIRVGGLWTHHANTGKFLDCIIDDWSDEEAIGYWSNALGVRIVRQKLQEDSYTIPTTPSVLKNIVKSTHIPFLIPNVIPLLAHFDGRL